MTTESTSAVIEKYECVGGPLCGLRVTIEIIDPQFIPLPFGGREYIYQLKGNKLFYDYHRN
jgi:hypothetical protein